MTFNLPRPSPVQDIRAVVVGFLFHFFYLCCSAFGRFPAPALHSRTARNLSMYTFPADYVHGIFCLCRYQVRAGRLASTPPIDPDGEGCCRPLQTPVLPPLALNTAFTYLIASQSFEEVYPPGQRICFFFESRPISPAACTVLTPCHWAQFPLNLPAFTEHSPRS